VQNLAAAMLQDKLFTKELFESVQAQSIKGWPALVMGFLWYFAPDAASQDPMTLQQVIDVREATTSVR
jgi:hypothetical protein